MVYENKLTSEELDQQKYGTPVPLVSCKADLLYDRLFEQHGYEPFSLADATKDHGSIINPNRPDSVGGYLSTLEAQGVVVTSGNFLYQLCEKRNNNADHNGDEPRTLLDILEI